jgi:hypothetical protein
MGTRCLTFVYDNGEPILNLYRQFDGYPEGHGVDLANFLNSFEAITNGISMRETRKTANGMGCLAAQMVAHFKQSVGGYYIEPISATDCGQDYEYHVYIDSVVVKNYNSEVIFSGTWKNLYKFCAKEEFV